VAQTPEQRVEWNQPADPFNIAGNIYFVGTAGLGAFLITDPKGHILLDGGLPESAPLIAANIQALGFKVEDVAYLLNSHAHADHAGGLAELKRLSGAKLVASAGDRPVIEAGEVDFRQAVPFPAVTVDEVVADGGAVRVGDTTMFAHVTPGHTKGCTTWTTKVQHLGKVLDVLFSCSLTVAGQDLVDDRGYPQAVADFTATFAKFKSLKADIFLANHPVFFDMEAKKARLGAGDKQAFVRPDELAVYVTEWQTAFDAELARQKSGGAP
jgi:metallo-beta-lactamase class B